MTAYFIRQRGDLCEVIALHPGDLEEAVQSGLSLPEAETLCTRLIDGLPKSAAPQACEHDSPRGVKPRRDPRQFTLKF